MEQYKNITDTINNIKKDLEKWKTQINQHKIDFENNIEKVEDPILKEKLNNLYARTKNGIINNDKDSIFTLLKELRETL